jgi:two-component system cell cycle sensor histidine kinase/response regulator CckA
MLQIVLLVEDDSIVRRFVTVALEQQSFIVLPAANAAEAIEICSKHLKIDLLLADVQIGGSINGIELAERITREKPEIKVLVMSGFPNREREAQEKCLPFLSKPFSHADLTSRVLAALSEMPQLSDSHRAWPAT